MSYPPACAVRSLKAYTLPLGIGHSCYALKEKFSKIEVSSYRKGATWEQLDSLGVAPSDTLFFAARPISLTSDSVRQLIRTLRDNQVAGIVAPINEKEMAAVQKDQAFVGATSLPKLPGYSSFGDVWIGTYQRVLASAFS